jgi:uncharacterized membrane protein (DUF373 family)
MDSEGPAMRGWRMRSTEVFQQIEHTLYVGLAVLLCATSVLALAGAAMMLWVGLADWAETNAVFDVIDRLLFVLMLVEILHTVLVSVRSGTLRCEPFLIVGLIASIRRILVITLKTSQATQQTMSDSQERIFRTSMIELGVLGMLILVMVVSIYLLRQVEPVSTSHGSTHRLPVED